MANTEEKIAMIEQALGCRLMDISNSILCAAKGENGEMLSPEGAPLCVGAVRDGEICLELNSAFQCPEGGTFKSYHRFSKKNLGLMLADLLVYEEMFRIAGD